jgi:hypothetical protein
MITNGLNFFISDLDVDEKSENQQLKNLINFGSRKSSFSRSSEPKIEVNFGSNRSFYC